MSNFLKIAQGADVLPLLLEIQRQPELWDKNPCRLSVRAPHSETHDIMLRYKDETENQRTGDWSDFSDQHIPDWYQSINHLPAARKLVFDLMARVQGEMLGAVFVYCVPPGAQIYPHIDKGWHPEFYDKFNICLQSNPGAAFCYDGERMVQAPGDVHHFRNDTSHWVVNEGTTDHIVLTVSIRLDRGYRAPWSPEGWTMDKFLDQEK